MKFHIYSGNYSNFQFQDIRILQISGYGASPSKLTIIPIQEGGKTLVLRTGVSLCPPKIRRRTRLVTLLLQPFSLH